MLREMEHLQFILWELRFSERQRCFPVLNAARGCKVTSLYFGQIHLSAGLRVSAFQKSTGLEPSKFRRQVIPQRKKRKALLFIHKKVWAFREFLCSFCPSLSWRWHEINFTFHWQDLSRSESRQQPPFSDLGFVYEQAKYAWQERKR